jgi:hypothetical protein
MLDLFTDSGATFSPCERYRYTLYRQWDATKPTLVMICCNPSKATAVETDPTVTRQVVRAKMWGFGRFEMLNAFALRSTDPRLLYQVDDPIGPENDAAIKAVVTRPDVQQVILGWGRHGKLMGRGQQLLRWLRAWGVTPYALTLTKSGLPRHPLYVSFETKPFVMDRHRMHTREMFNKLTPQAQGFMWYMEAQHPGSPLPRECPYQQGTEERRQWDEGVHQGILVAMDEEN